MKRYRFLAAVAVLSLGLPHMSATAGEPDEELINIDASKVEQSEENSETDLKEIMLEEDGINHLQVPEKLQIVLDPWEMDGKGQIYSDVYKIQNVGDAPGILVLSNIACQTGSQSGVDIKTDTKGLHDDTEKSLYMVMLIGDEDKIVLSQEGAEYKVELKAGEELSFAFSGEANENAEKGWTNGDVSVTATYSWEPREVTRELVEVQEADSQEKENQETSEEQEEKKEPLVMELKEAGQREFLVDSWEIDEQGYICSPLYQLRNMGEEVGTFAWLEPVCKTAEQSGIFVRIEKENLHQGEEKYVYMELIQETAGQEEGRYVLLPEFQNENLEVTEYKVEIEPGEEVAFRLMGELSGVKPEELREGDIAVTAVCSWSVGGTASE